MWWHRFVGLRFQRGGRDRLGVDCWGLYRLLVFERSGFLLPSHDTVPGDYADIVLAIAQNRVDQFWTVVPPDQERELDLVLMRGLARDADGKRIVGDMHVGCALGDGLMLHCDEGQDTIAMQWRSTAVMAAHPRIARRVVGLYRPRLS